MIALIHGPSGSGKTKRLARTVVLSERYNLSFIILKPSMTVFKQTREIKVDGIDPITNNVYIWGVDEIPLQEKRLNFVLVEDVQFFSIAEIDSILYTATRIAKDLVFYGVRYDYTGKPFESMEYLLSDRRTILDVVQFLSVKCSVCKRNEATKTQRYINSVPAGFGPRIFVADFVEHKSVCELCYSSPIEVEQGGLN